MLKRFVLVVLLVCAPALAAAQALTDDQIRDAMIQQSVNDYRRFVGNCPCPWNNDAAGRSCGARSAWSRPGGESPLCYRSDITATMVQAFRVTGIVPR